MSELPQENDFSPDHGNADDQWYVQHGSRLQGPYSAQDIGRYLLLGRIRRQDRVSRDGELWEPVTQVPELVPEELLDLDNEQGWQEYLEKYRRVDERRAVCGASTPYIDDSEFRAPQFNHLEIDAERRLHTEISANQEVREDWQQPTQEPQRSSRPMPQPISLLPISLLGMTLVALLVVIYLNTVDPLL